MTDLRNAQLTDLLPKSVAEQQWVQSVSDAWHDLTLLILDFADNAKVYTGIDQASDELLDILATQFRAPRYRQDYDIETAACKSIAAILHDRWHESCCGRCNA